MSRDDIPREPADETEQATEANRVANEILAKAKHHKRLSGYHRQKSRDLMTRFEQFKQRCADMVIAVKGEGEIIHGRKQRKSH